MVEFDTKPAAVTFLTTLQHVLLSVERHTPTYVGLEGLLVPRDKATLATGPLGALGMWGPGGEAAGRAAGGAGGAQEVGVDGVPMGPGVGVGDPLYIEDSGQGEGEAELGSLAAALSAAEEADLQGLLEHLLGGSGGDMQEFVSSLQAELDALEVRVVVGGGWMVKEGGGFVMHGGFVVHGGLHGGFVVGVHYLW